MTALPSGSRKSAVFADVFAPLRELEARERRRNAGDVAKAQAARKIKEARLKRLQEEAARAKANPTAESAAEALAAELAATTVPHTPSLIFDDCTPEKIPGLLAQNGARIAILSPEGDMFNVMAGRYSANRAPNFAVLLKGHSGDPIRVDRVGRAVDNVPNPAITIGLTLQPEVIRGLASTSGFRGTGLLARFLYSTPRSLVGRRIVNPPPVPDEVRRRFHESMAALHSLSPHSTDDREQAPPHILRLTPEASALFIKFETELEPALAEFGSLGPISDWGSKLCGPSGALLACSICPV